MSITPQLKNTFNCFVRLIIPPLRANCIQGRHASVYRKDCFKGPKCVTDSPRCTKEKLEKTPCAAKAKEKRERKESIYKIFLEKQSCCPVTCPQFPPFDDLYYKPTDKACREYEQTWVECPQIKMVPKEICCNDILDYPPMETRKHKRPKTACIDKKASCKTGPCPKIKMPRCSGIRVRDPPRCKIFAKPTGCKKKCTPYPAFSECSKPKIRPRRPIECNCLAMVALCDVLMKARRMAALNNKSQK